MKKYFVISLAILGLMMITACSQSSDTSDQTTAKETKKERALPKLKSSGLTEITKEDFFKLIKDENSQPFLFISTDADKKLFDKKMRKVYENNLDNYDIGAFYLNIYDEDKDVIDEINEYSSYKGEYDASSDGLVIVRHGEIEVVSNRFVLNQKILEDNIEFENEFNDLQKEATDNVTDVVEEFTK